MEPPSFPELRIRPDLPRILMLYGYLRERSHSRLLAEEAARVLVELGAEVEWFHSHDSYQEFHDDGRMKRLLRPLTDALIEVVSEVLESRGS